MCCGHDFEGGCCLVKTLGSLLSARKHPPSLGTQALDTCHRGQGVNEDPGCVPSSSGTGKGREGRVPPGTNGNIEHKPDRGFYGFVLGPEQNETATEVPRGARPKWGPGREPLVSTCTCKHLHMCTYECKHTHTSYRARIYTHTHTCAMPHTWHRHTQTYTHTNAQPKSVV